MKYVQPYGISDPDAPYINGNPSTGQQGSIPPAAAFEHPMREISGVISKSKITPTETDLLQMIKAIRSQRSNFAEDTGSLNTLSVAYDPPITQYTLGLPLRVRVLATNTGACTIEAGAGRVPVRRPDGNNNQPGDLPAGGIVDLMYDGTGFQQVNYLGGASTGDITNVFQNVPYCVDSSSTANIITANFAPAITALQAGTIFMVKIANTNTAATIINVNGIASKAVLPTSGGALLPGDVTAGDIKLFKFDGTNFYLDPNPLIPNNVTINVPGQYATFDAVQVAISRKTISRFATVTIKLAQGVFPPITFIHKDGSNIVIEGTMKAAAPTLANFARTGNSPAARAQDAANNIVMLRSRYGTEISVPMNNVGFKNIGPGSPKLKDILIVGQAKGSGGDINSGNWTYGITSDHYAPLNTALIVTNVAIWGCYYGFFVGGQVTIESGSCSNCYQGITALHGGRVATHYLTSVGNDWAGAASDAGSNLAVKWSEFQCNGVMGCYSAASSTIHLQACNITTNGHTDCFATAASTIMCWVGGGASNNICNTFNPPPYVVGNNNSIIIA